MSGFGPRTANTFNKPPQGNAGYVAGIGRGAVGFTTRSDIGPARPSFEGGSGPPGGPGSGPGGAPNQPNNPFYQPNFGQAPAGYVAGRGRGMGDLARSQTEGPAQPSSAAASSSSSGAGGSAAAGADNDRGDYSESNFDAFAGYGERLFSAGMPYEEDDREADQIYASIDKAMENRRKRSREKEMLENQGKPGQQTQLVGGSSARPTIGAQFADLKRELGTVSMEEWEAIPDVGDHSLKLKQSRKKESFAPLPDFMIESASQRNGVMGRVEQAGGSGGLGGMETPFRQLMSSAANGGKNSTSSASEGGTQTVTTGLAEARGRTLTSRLDTISDSVSGQTVVDPKGYLTDLNSLKVSSDDDVGDFKKARALLASVTSTNPKHAPGWIAAARIEEVAGKMVQARKIIRQGCEICPESEDVWIEAVRLHIGEDGKKILADAVKHVPNSVRIWIQAADLEDTLPQKKVVLRRALEFIPNSVKLWKTAIQLEDVADARIMLARAVECVPQSVEMWLALAKLETHENARMVLNQCREANPTELAPWVTAAKLEEAHGNQHLVDRIVSKMIVSLGQLQVAISRDTWLKEARLCEASGAPLTCASIVKHTVHLNVDEEDRLATWMDDAETCLHPSLSMSPDGSDINEPSIETARAIYSHARSVYPKKKALWLASAVLEKDHGNMETLEAVLKNAVKHCPQAEVLWLMAAKEKWMHENNVPAARAILVEAFDANPQSEQIWLAAVKLEWENNEFQRARMLLARARERCKTSERIWMKSALLERECGDLTQELTLLDKAIHKFSGFHKLYLMAGQACEQQVEEQEQGQQRAKGYYQDGLKHCPTCVPLWRSLVRLEERVRGVNKARSTMELARLKLPLNEELLLENIRLERRHGNEKLADSLLAKAIQDHPTSGLLWAEDVLTCPKHQQKSKSVDALKKCDNDPFVIVAVARLFERDHKLDKARKWFERAVQLNAKYGDAWAHYYAFELRQQLTAGGSATAERLLDQIIKRCANAEPNRGELWCEKTKVTELRRLDVPTKLKKVVESLLQQQQPASAK